jgi:hypothetical protein
MISGVRNIREGGIYPVNIPIAVDAVGCIAVLSNWKSRARDKAAIAAGDPELK